MRRHRGWRVWLVTLLLGSFIVLFPVGWGGAEQVIFVLPAKTLSSLPLFVGMRAGFFKEAGLTVKPLVMKANLALKAMLAGDADYSLVIGSAAQAAVTGIPVRVVGFFLENTIFYFYVRPEIREAAQLKGGTVAVEALGSTTAVGTQAVLRALGLDPARDVTMVQLGADPTRLAAMKGGSVVASLFAPPYTALAAREGFRPLLYLGDIRPLPQAGIATTVKKIGSNPAQVRGVLAATVRGLTFIHQRRQETVGIIRQEWDLDQDVAAGSYDAIIKAVSRDGRASGPAIQALIEGAKRTVEVRRDVPMGDVVDLSLLPK